MAKNQQHNPASNVRSEFVSTLLEARDKAGGNLQLYEIIGHGPRTIQKWLSGQGPRFGMMEKVFPMLQKFLDK